MYTVTLSYNKSNHINQYVCGFLLLEKQKIIKITNITQPCYNIKIQHILRAEVNGKKIVFDANDGDHIDRGFFSLTDYDWCDLYFKRSFSQQLSDSFPKCRPLSFNYDIKPIFSKPEDFMINIRRLLGKDIIKYKDLEAEPIATDNPRILFFTRLWDPESVKLNHKTNTAKIISEYNKLNDFRLMVLDTLREKFSSISTFGLSDNEFTRKIAKNYILPPELTRRRHFISSLKKHEICIATTGLHDSIGWRFGEYIASSRAIISDPLIYTPTGNYNNFLAFTNQNELVLAIDRLINDKKLRSNMMINNKNYYSDYLRPDKLVLNSIMSL